MKSRPSTSDDPDKLGNGYVMERLITAVVILLIVAGICIVCGIVYDRSIPTDGTVHSKRISKGEAGYVDSVAVTNPDIFYVTIAGDTVVKNEVRVSQKLYESCRPGDKWSQNQEGGYTCSR